MRHFVFGFLAITGLLGVFAPVRPAQAAQAENARYILFLTADGFRTDYIEWYHPTNLERLISEGVRAIHVTNVFPTITTPNMTALLTGAYPRTSGIGGNTQYIKEEDKLVDSPRDNRAETIAETVHKAGWKTGAVNHFMLRDRGADFYVSAGYDEAAKTADALIKLFAEKKVRFAAAIFGAADHAGHKFGPRSQEVKTAVLEIDREIGRVIRALKDLRIYEQTLITFNADHGMSAYENKQASPDVAHSLREAGFKVATGKGPLEADAQIIVEDAGVRVVYFRPSVSNAEKARVEKILRGIEGAEVLDRKQLDALGCHDNRSGDLIVSPLPGYTMSRAGGSGGLHGRFAEQNPVLFFRGPGFKKGATVESARTIDVVPILLHLVNVKPARTVDGAVLESVLTP